MTAYLIWTSHAPLKKDTRYLIKHTTKVLCGRVNRLNHKIDINTFEKLEADSLQFNEIGEVQIDLHNPIFATLTSATGPLAVSLSSILSTMIRLQPA